MSSSEQKAQRILKRSTNTLLSQQASQGTFPAMALATYMNPQAANGMGASL